MTIYSCTESDRRILFADDLLELAFDRQTGRWMSLRERATDTELLTAGGEQASVMMGVGGVTSATRMRHQWASVVDAEEIGARSACTGYECTAGERGPTLTLHTRQGDWSMDQRYTLVQGAARVERSLRITYQGEGEALLRWADLRVPPANLGPVKDCFIHAPGYPTKANQPLANAPFGELWDRLRWDMAGGTPGRAAPGWYPGLIGLENPARSLSLAVWAYSDLDPAFPGVRRGDRGTHTGHRVMLADRLSAGHAVEFTGQYVQLFHQPWREALIQWQRWYGERGVVAAQAPAWARQAHIYELFIGINEARSSNKFPEMEQLITDLPRIKELGFDVIQIMPHQPFPTYSVVDYYNVDTHYGSAEGLRRLTARAHELDMRVVLDVILHGVLDGEAVRAIHASQGRVGWLVPPELPDRHPYRVEHPEWFMETEYGTPAATYTWAFDHANESWRDFMVEVFTHYVREYDVDGFRVDALTWNCFPNWAKGLPYRASASFFGSAEMAERARGACQKTKPEVVFYTETPGARFMPGYDLVYNYDMQWLFSALVTPISPRGFAYNMCHATEHMDAADVGPWLEQHLLTKPAGATTVHHLDSHDTNEWGGLMQYRREAFGEEASRALFGLCCALKGPLMMFQGAEDGAEGYYRRLLQLRRELPALGSGSADYTAITVDDRRVFAPLRTHERQVVLPLVNIQNRPTEVTLGLPVERLGLRGRYYVLDRLNEMPLPGPHGDTWSADELLALRVLLTPWQVRVLELMPVP